MTDDQELAQILADRVVRSASVGRIIVIGDETAYGKGIADSFAGQVSRTSAIAVDRRTWDRSAIDDLVDTVQVNRPDAIFFGGMDVDVALLIRKLSQADLHPRIMGGDGVCSAELFRLTGGTLQDSQVECGEGGGTDPGHAAATKAFEARFQQRFGHAAVLYAPYSYDATQVLAEAMARANSSNPARYLPELARTHHEGVTGTIEFDDKGDIRNGNVTLYTYVGGQRVKTHTVSRAPT
jgi:branched-chain amino acid transport system substrate-binding protein